MATREDQAFNRREKAELRALTEEAWAEELKAALLELHEDFEKWGSDFIGPFELNERIHKFHDGISRELYTRYTSKSHVEVAKAIANGWISQESVSESLLEKLQSLIKYFSRRRKSESDAEAE